MPRTVRNSKLENRAARDRLPAQRKPYWHTLEPGALHLGYRKRRAGAPGKWTLRRYAGNGKYAEETLGTADDFQDANGHSILSFAQAQQLAHGSTAPTFYFVADAMKDYVASLDARGKLTSDAIQRANLHILPALGNIRVEHLTTRMLVEWRDALAAAPSMLRNRKPRDGTDRRARRSTVNRILQVLRAALNLAFKHGHVHDDREWRRVSTFRAVSAARQRFLTVEEAQRLLNGCEPCFRSLVHGALLTGARYGELCALRCADFRNGKVHVPAEVSKTRTARDISLTAEGVALFKQLTTGRAGDDILFRRANGTAFARASQQIPMRDACVNAGMKPVGFHQLRHTYASLSVMSGMSLTVLAKQLGHTSTKMLELHYAHLARSHIDDAVEAHAPRFGVVSASNVRPLRGQR